MSSPADDDYDPSGRGSELRPKPKSDVPIPDVDSTASADLAFDTDEVGKQLRQADEETLHEAPFGIVRLDDEGTVEFYNHYESTLSGVDPEDAIGQDFFTQLAPCSNNNLFRGRFREGVEEGTLDERFTYTFTYKMRPTLVDVRLYRDDAGLNWVLIHKR
jgi:photoactive yellow protein